MRHTEIELLTERSFSSWMVLFPFLIGQQNHTGITILFKLINLEIKNVGLGIMFPEKQRLKNYFLG